MALPPPAMRALSALLLAVTLAASASAQPAPEAARLVATVVDTTGVPIAGASVRMIDGTAGTASGADGVAELALPPGPAVIVVSAVGYASATFTVAPAPSERMEGVVTLDAASRLLGEVETVAEGPRADLVRTGFYERQAEGRGSYLTRDDFEARSLHTVRDALVGSSGVQLITWDGARVAVSTRGVTGPDGALQNVKPCPLSVFVDGHEVPGETANLEAYPTADLAGLEVYVGTAQTPLQYGRFNPCGVILLWTRVE